MTDAKITSTVAKSEDKTIQITFTVPFELIKKAQDAVITEVGQQTEIPGFRKGKAPAEKVKEKIAANVLLEKTLAKILPEALTDVINENKIRPAIYPKFELLKAKEGEDWQIRATTCELPEVILGDYKRFFIKTEAKTSRDEKEQKVIKTLLETVKVEVPNLVIKEEVDNRLSNLLERLEKLGLTLEGYLGSLGKNPEKLRVEYELQAKNSIALELILNAIVAAEKIEVKEAQVDEAIKASSADPKLAEKLNTPEQRHLIKGILLRRGALDYLTSLV